MSQHHYIIQFDTDTRKWTWDWDSEDTRFPDGTIYLPEFDNKWTDLSDLDPQLNQVLGKVDESASKAVVGFISLLNSLMEQTGTDNG